MLSPKLHSPSAAKAVSGASPPARVAAAPARDQRSACGSAGFAVTAQGGGKRWGAGDISEPLTGTSSRAGSSLRRILLVVTAVVAVAAAAVVALAFLADTVSSDLEKQEECCWAEGATPAWVSQVTGLRIPTEASDVRVGYHRGSRYDTALMAFTLPDKKADEYLAQLTAEGSKMIENTHPRGKDYSPAVGFAHLGIPEPETFVKGMRMGNVCRGDVDTPDGKKVQYCAKLFAHRFTTGSTRIFTRTGIEPSLTPPPAKPKA